MNLNNFEIVQIRSNLVQRKKSFKLEKFKIKYGCEGFDVRNIFLIETSPHSGLIWN
jgi:hypothetical protein